MSSRATKPKSGAPEPGPQTPEVALGPSLEFMRNLWRLNHAAELMSGQMERVLGVTAQQRMIIRCLGKHPHLTPSLLAATLHVDRSTISTALRRMEKNGLVVRRSDAHDGRRVALALSAKGRRIEATREETVEKAVDRLLRAETKRNIVISQRVMRALAHQLELATTGGARTRTQKSLTKAETVRGTRGKSQRD